MVTISGQSIEERDWRADRISRIRRAIFAFTTTFVCIGSSTAFVFMGFTGGLAERVAEALLNYAELMAILYLGAGVIDRSQILQRIGFTLTKKESDK